jgi:tetratricopeptide (TPR) repeat protein
MQEYEYNVHPLRIARVERGLTQEDLGQDTKLGVSTIRRAEQWFPLNIKTQRILSTYFNKTAKELGLMGRGWMPGSAQPVPAPQPAPNPSQPLPKVAAPTPLLHKTAPSAQYTPTQAIELLGAQPNIVTEQHAEAWLALGTSHLAQLFDEGWSLENILESLRVVLQGVQGLPTINRRKLLQLSSAAAISGITLSTNVHVSEEEKIRLIQTMGESIATSFSLFHTMGNAQVFTVAQTQLYLLQQIHMHLNPRIQSSFYSSVYSLLGLTLHLQERFEESLRLHSSAHIAARESGDIWRVTQSLTCQVGTYQSVGQHTEAIQLIETALRLIEDQTDEKYLRLQAHLLANWADSAAAIGEHAITQKKLERSAELLDRISPKQEFDKASWLQMAGKCALMRGDHIGAIHECEQALIELPQNDIFRQTITFIPLAIAHARNRDRDASLAVAEKTLPSLQALNAPITNKLFIEYIRDDLVAAYPHDSRVRSFVTDIQITLSSLNNAV